MKFNKKSILAVTITVFTFSVIAFDNTDHSNHYAGMKHTDTAASHSDSKKIDTVLTESGTDPFATLQEVIKALEANPNIRWENVNLEALRLHLLQMQDMVMNVEVSQKPIKNGFQAVVSPTTDRALKSLVAVFSAHPAQMKKETGWDMQVTNNNGVFTATVTTSKANEIAKIRGLGYIGVIAYGGHHQPHHWAMASGNNPHDGHNMKY